MLNNESTKVHELEVIVCQIGKITFCVSRATQYYTLFWIARLIFQDLNVIQNGRWTSNCEKTTIISNARIKTAFFVYAVVTFSTSRFYCSCTYNIFVRHYIMNYDLKSLQFFLCINTFNHVLWNWITLAYKIQFDIHKL